MIDVSFVLIFFLFPILMFFLMEITGLSMFRLNIPSFVVVSMFLFSYIGIFPLYFGLDEYRLEYVQDKYIMLKVFFFTSYTILTLVMGFLCAKRFLPNNSISLSHNIRALNKSELFYISILIIFTAAVLMLYLSKISRVAIEVALFDSVSESMVARSKMGNDFHGKYHRYSVIMHDLANVLTFTLFAAWLTLKKKKILLLLVVAFSISAFSAIMATEKAPFAWLLIGLFFTHILVRNEGRVPVKKTVVFLLFVFAFLTLFNFFFMGISDNGSALLSVFSRAFTGAVQPAYHYLEFFPEHQGFLLGKSFPNPGGLLPFEPYMLTRELMMWTFPHLAGNGIVGSMPTVFWGELYANFGILGVMLLPLLVGFFLYIFSFVINRLENTPLKIGLIVWLLFHYKNLAATGISAFIIDAYLFVILFFVLSVIMFSNKFKIKLRHRVRV
jgi:oligosaccharide repeat unit polymerase